jgi:hypothetical protein
MAFRIPVVAKDFSFLIEHPDKLFVPYNLILSSYRCKFLGLKRPEVVTDHLPPSTAKVKISGGIPLPPPPYTFMA